MANKGGYNYTFVEEPSEDFKCPICLLVLRNPHLTGCCGRNFCESCIKSSRQRSSQCPLCSGEDFQSMRDLREERKILSLEVYCTNWRDGCTWKGTVKEIDDHLRPSEVEGECRYEFLLCPYKCGSNLRRYEMKKHMSEECFRRPFTCKYCTYSATYGEVTLHYVECVKYPVGCPNRCHEECDIPRGEVSRHLTECPLQVVPCPFKEQGCGEECMRNKLSQHLEDKVHEHLSLVSSQFGVVVKKMQSLEQENAELKERVTRSECQLRESISEVLKKMESLEQENAELKERVTRSECQLRESISEVLKKMESLEQENAELKERVIRSECQLRESISEVLKKKTEVPKLCCESDVPQMTLKS